MSPVYPGTLFKRGVFMRNKKGSVVITELIILAVFSLVLIRFYIGINTVNETFPPTIKSVITLVNPVR